MENIKAQIAFDLMPLMRLLNKGGIMFLYPTGGTGGQVQMTVKAFCETFPDAIPQPNRDSDYPWKWTQTVEGVEFFALAENQERP